MASSAQVITLYAQSIPGLFQIDKQGAYDQVIQLVTPKTDQLVLRTLPNSRATKAFLNCQSCCYSPSNLNPNFYSFGADVSMTSPINTAKAYIFSRKGDVLYSNLSQLTNKTVGIERGMNYGKNVEDASFIPSITNSLLQNFKMLQVKRVDAMIAYEPDIYQAFKHLDAEQFHYNKNKAITIHQDALVCRGVNSEFIKGFNQNLEDLRKTGQLKALLGELYVDP